MAFNCSRVQRLCQLKSWLFWEILRQEIPPVSLSAAATEPYIGIDQGIKTFSMAAIDKSPKSLLKVVDVAQVG